MHHLSKSKLISGLQCPKRLWLEVNEPGQQAFTPATEAAFETGHVVGRVAQSLYPGGVLIEHDGDLSTALQETARMLEEPGPLTLFEATFQADGVLVRVDVLVRDENQRFRVIEVKSSTKVKDYHLNDCAIQLWVLEQLGLPVDAVELAHIDNQFVYPGGGAYEGLFHHEDVLDRARELQDTVPGLIAEFRAVLDDGEPRVPMGKHCTTPFDCPFIGYCEGPQAEFPVSWLPGGGRVHEKLLEAGYRDIRDIPEGQITNEAREWCRRVTASGQPELRPEAARELRELGWPRYYLDFETMGPAVPVFAGTRPYNAQAFQWSCHVETQDGAIEHREFLATGAEPPMRPCAESLIDAVGTEGPVFVYSGYEQRVIRDLANLYPDLAPALEAILPRLFDLLPVTRRNYYHPDMQGSWSIKRVLPTVAPDLDYDGLEHVSVGTDAERAFLEVMHPDTPPERLRELREALLRYCRMDTEAMVRIAHFLEGRERVIGGC